MGKPMNDSETYAMRDVNGNELHLRRRRKGDPWEVSLCDRIMNAHTAMIDRMLWTETISGQYFRGRTFPTPEAAVEFVRQLVA
jgi:hypothetical protein